RAASQAPLVIGFVLDPAGQGTLPRLPFATRGAPSLGGSWRADGAGVPPPTLIGSAHGIRALSLSGARAGGGPNVPLPAGGGGRGARHDGRGPWRAGLSPGSGSAAAGDG